MTVDGDGLRAARSLAAGFDYWDPQQMQDPHEAFDVLREQCPVSRSDRLGGYWLVTRYEHLREVVLNPRTYSSRFTFIPHDAFGETFASQPPNTLDPPLHTRMRKLIQPMFAPRVISRYEPVVRSYARELVADLRTRTECDAYKDFAQRVPVQMMICLLGLAKQDERKFADWVQRLVEIGPRNKDDAAQAGVELAAFLAEQVSRCRMEPDDSVVTLLANSEVDGERLTDDLLIPFLFFVLAAAIDSTAAVLNAALWHLAERPADRAFLAEDPARIPAAVEEFVRYFAPGLVARVATESADLAGERIDADDSLLLCYPSANRDPAVFERPAELLVDRKDNPHCGFGLGIHRCLGAPIAQLELRIALEEWLAGIPEFRVSRPEKIRWSTGPVWGLRELHLGIGA